MRRIFARNCYADGAVAHQRSNKSRIDDALHFVAEHGWGVAGEVYFADLVVFLSKSLGVSHVNCSSVDVDGSPIAKSLANFANGNVTTKLQYPLHGTPCENVFGNHLCCHEDNVQELFPDDKFFVEHGIRSYAGIPLWTADDEPLGLLSVMDINPMDDPDLVQSVLKIVAVRTGAEMERARVLSRLRESEQRLADFARVSSDWFWETDEQLRFSYFSSRFEDVTGVPQSVLLGKTREEVGAPGANPTLYMRLLEDMREHRPFRDFHHHRVKPNGDMVHLAISGMPTFDDERQFIGYRGIGRDITEQKKTELELMESRDNADRASRAKSEFLATMSHEFRTPLNAILGFSEILASEMFGPLGHNNYREYAEDILNSGRLMSDLVNDILDIATIEAGKRSIQRTMFDPRSMLADCIRRIDRQAEQRGVSVTLKKDSSLRDIFADERALTQIILNLLSNAVKFTLDGGVVLVSAAIENDVLELEVKDSGVGIPPDKLSDITEPFSQSHSNPHVSQQGTGLGLAIVKSLVDIHEGTLSISSTLSEGTCVTVQIPLIKN